ncbi:hypothetical protein HYW84_01475 [Candidatus Peregrinibacteria bacterium]|nr:hypothetical protein [Candidatus Peregrinibacteria bacterium]
MPTQTSAGSQQLPTGEVIYNAIMSQIEPDLATNSEIRTDAREKGESAAKFKARMERYRKAFSLYEKCFDAYVEHLRGESKNTRSAARIATEQRLHDEETAEADKLLSEMTRA